ncbi:MAG TPA: hypothetical protein VJX23_02915 [Candidatus Binataceae bacterium]|nr:hypothetical protein [Candidatus Binataceae bacterium]
MKKAWQPCTIALLLILIGCSAWPTIITTAEAIASVTTVFIPGVASFSAVAVHLLNTAASAAQAYHKNKTSSTEQAYVAAVQAIEEQLPADLAALVQAGMSAEDEARVSAAVNIILDFVEAEAAQLPPTAALVTQKRAARQAGPMPKPLSARTIKARWNSEVCVGDRKCQALLD